LECSLSARRVEGLIFKVIACGDVGVNVPEIARSAGFLASVHVAKCMDVGILRIRLKLNADCCRHVYLPIEECHPFVVYHHKEEGEDMNRCRAYLYEMAGVDA
jgi:hypothetical protein